MSDRANYTLEDMELEALSLQFDILSSSSDTKEKEVVSESPVPTVPPTKVEEKIEVIEVIETLTKLQDKIDNFFVQFYPTDYKGLNTNDLIVKIKSITLNTISQGISSLDIGKYYRIGDKRSTGFNIKPIKNNNSTNNNWSIWGEDLEYYQIKEEFISKSDHILSSIYTNTPINRNGEKENDILLKNKSLYGALNCVFDKTGWDYSYFSSDNFKIYIHYPEINVKSSDGVSERLLKNVFVILQFYDNKLLHFGMFKTTYYDDELTPNSNGYEFFRHPHIQKINTTNLLNNLKKTDNGISDFCLGSGTGISTLFTKLHSKQCSEDEYIEFLFSIKPYLEWESLEGVPYHKLSDIKKTSRARIRLNEIFGFPIESAINEILRKDTNIKLYYGDKIRIMKDSAFYNYMDKSFPVLKSIAEISSSDNTVTLADNNNNNSSQYLNTIKRINSGVIPSFKFNNQIFNLEIINKEESSFVPVIPDRIINEYIQKIEDVIND